MRASAEAAPVRPTGAAGECAVLERLMDWPVLARLGWDPGRGVFAPASGDAVFGFTECRRGGCDRVAATNSFACCKVAACGRWAAHCKSALCPSRYVRWTREGRAGEDPPQPAAICRLP